MTTDTEYKTIKVAIDRGVGVITLNRPEALNTFTGGMGEEWQQAQLALAADDDVRVIVVTGAGAAFCAGADLSGGGDTFDKQEDMSFSSCPITPAYQLKKPVIAACNGHAIGVGFSLALQADFRFLSKQGKYGLLQAQRGVLADGCAHWLLPRLIGMEKALELMLTGQKMTGEQAHEKGLALQVVEADQVLETAMAFAYSLAEKSSPLVVGLAKQLMWQSHDMSAEQMEALETKLLHQSMGLPDAIEGGVAFMERRTPTWTSSINNDWPTWWLADEDKQ
ncbi:putative enoyl-CoA hydratase echA8 [Sinobacterium norvegicum]|uniref:Enoyl-CoA hydratase echA8 n=1 Tax=Sinobacterium norvegicum TaxID=1641715 RepID=A0ABM9AF12_9GAMM|nr:enoyl-CoA hydratase-related protein [Sinobacterium norvegicum]CAH0991708.1 putative enoyl-CoA hydratase echA8 [Sinobacterium norvegicum]